MNKWKEIWEKRTADDEFFQTSKDPKLIWQELKRIDGFDVGTGEDPKDYYDSFYNMWDKGNQQLTKNVGEWDSIFEVGCGAGATLYLFAQIGKLVSGIDYSSQSVEIAKKILKDADIKCLEANKITTDEKYDIVMADSVFAYFQDEKYALEVLNKMYDKAQKAVFITEVFNKDLEKECLSYRRSQIPNYDQRYKDLDKLFLPKDFFKSFMRKKKGELVYTNIDNKYYWNSKFMYNVLIIK